MLRLALVAVVVVLVLPRVAEAQDPYSLAGGCYTLQAGACAAPASVSRTSSW